MLAAQARFTTSLLILLTFPDKVLVKLLVFAEMLRQLLIQ
jgi:hypothetical protein